MTVALSSPSRTAFPLRKIIGQGQLHGEGVAVVDAVDEELGGHAAHFFDGDVHSGKHGRNILCDVNIIHADHRDIIWNVIAAFLDSPDVKVQQSRHLSYRP